MVLRNKDGALTEAEKRVVKSLLNKGWRNQDIQAFINIGRPVTINSARITEVKKNDQIFPANEDEVEFFKIKKKSFDIKTGLNIFDDERLIRAREAMILSVHVFNSPAFCFKTEMFTMLTNVAWTYLLHEYYQRQNVEIIGRDGRTLLLSQMIDRNDCPLSKGIKDNIRAIKILRDDVEHKILGRSDKKWLGIFQACCLNFEKTICSLFGENMTLSHELSFALQFSKLNFEQASILNRYEIPAHIDAVDARLTEGMTEEQIADIEYQFRVVYTLDSVTKSRAHFQFIQPNSAEGKEIRNVLVQHKLADQLYPHRPQEVVDKIKENTGKNFTLYNHTQAWKKYRIRPKTGAAQPDNTNKEYCIYHFAHHDYTYSEQWVRYLEDIVNDEEAYRELLRFKI